MPESQAYFQRLRLMNSFSAWSHAIRSKRTGLQSPALSLLKSLPALCRAELAEPLSADSAQTEPCAPIRDKFAFGKFCFFLIIHLSLALTRYGDSWFQSTMLSFISSPLRGRKMRYVRWIPSLNNSKRAKLHVTLLGVQIFWRNQFGFALVLTEHSFNYWFRN